MAIGSTRCKRVPNDISRGRPQVYAKGIGQFKKILSDWRALSRRKILARATHLETNSALRRASRAGPPAAPRSLAWRATVSPSSGNTPPGSVADNSLPLVLASCVPQRPLARLPAAWLSLIGLLCAPWPPAAAVAALPKLRAFGWRAADLLEPRAIVPVTRRQAPGARRAPLSPHARRAVVVPLARAQLPELSRPAAIGSSTRYSDVIRLK